MKKKEEIRSFMYRERVNYIQTKCQIMRERERDKANGSEVDREPKI